MKSADYQEALDQLDNLHNTLLNGIPPAYHSSVFILDGLPSISAPQADTLSSCNYASYASELLQSFNPQGSDDDLPTTKRFQPTSITYSSALTGSSPQEATITTSSLTSHEIDRLYDMLSARFSTTLTPQPQVDISTLEHQVSTTSAEIQLVEQDFAQSIASVATSVSNLTTKVDSQYSEIKESFHWQNAVIVNIHEELGECMLIISKQLQLQLPSCLLQQLLLQASHSSPAFHQDDTTAIQQTWSPVLPTDYAFRLPVSFYYSLALTSNYSNNLAKGIPDCLCR
jgi:hypothetical protein